MFEIKDWENYKRQMCLLNSVKSDSFFQEAERSLRLGFAPPELSWEEVTTENFLDWIAQGKPTIARRLRV